MHTNIVCRDSVVPRTSLAHAKLLSLTSPCCRGRPTPTKTPQGQKRELGNDGCADFNAWLGGDLVLIINFNSTYISKYMANDLCYLLLIIIGTDITNSAIHSSGPSRGLFTSTNDYASAQWRLMLHILVTFSPHVNKCWVTRAIYGIHCGWSHWPTTIQHVQAQWRSVVSDGLVRQELKRPRECPEILEILKWI